MGSQVSELGAKRRAVLGAGLVWALSRTELRRHLVFLLLSYPVPEEAEVRARRGALSPRESGSGQRR